MDGLPQEILQQLGSYALAAFLAWWIIKTQRDELRAEREEKKELVERFIELSEKTRDVLSGLKAELKGGG